MQYGINIYTGDAIFMAQFQTHHAAFRRQSMLSRALSAQSLHTTSGYIVHQIVFLSSTPIHRGDKMYRIYIKSSPFW